jgi:hypothetical protein
VPLSIGIDFDAAHDIGDDADGAIGIVDDQVSGGTDTTLPNITSAARIAALFLRWRVCHRGNNTRAGAGTTC